MAHKCRSVHELIELRKLRQARQGIDAAKLSAGDVKRQRKRTVQELEGDDVQYGLRPGARVAPEEEDGRDDDKTAKARRAVRANNFTQQTNVLDVDKHMMAYIEENMKVRRGQKEDVESSRENGSSSELLSLADRLQMQKTTDEEGNVTNSMAMLTAIPEVDLGMDVRLRNIEDTEKAKLVLTQEKKERRKPQRNDEEHLVSTRFYRPNLKMKSDADIIRDAKREAMGLPPQEEEQYRPRNDRPQTATDDIVMERFKKRMRK
ncbi:hepatocellular carcinoma-associated antigen 59-domain-containing protein [Vararia minispora EC-137]|uniref:Hepatocellular carcinoma-associated antigen 59-domain-containing protein n=1 Tax=Vararia minispora EC-137 TaxID=1314806 RepID=A0ACB8QBI6_9AGAM|nr:hepatocellular carcinoma-associated antigen 59-domain-containing protein [Vararia minispora EC-137]